MFLQLQVWALILLQESGGVNWDLRSLWNQMGSLAKQARIQGVVRLNAIIGKDGTIQNLTVATGHPLLVPAALEAVKQWVYRPTLLNGEAVEVVTQIDVNFTLSQ